MGRFSMELKEKTGPHLIGLLLGTIGGSMLGLAVGHSFMGGSAALLGMAVVGAAIGAAVGRRW